MFFSTFELELPLIDLLCFSFTLLPGSLFLKHKLKLLVALYLVLSQLILSEERPQVIFKFIKLLIVSKPAFNPLAQLVIDYLFFVPLVNEENARIVALVSDTSPDDLIDFSNGSHLVPIVTCYLLVVVTIQVSHLIVWHA